MYMPYYLPRSLASAAEFYMCYMLGGRAGDGRLGSFREMVVLWCFFGLHYDCFAVDMDNFDNG